jgi:putative effector of murein hydrolase LrgA (UPF0299 family)
MNTSRRLAPKAPEELTRVTDGLLANMPILFVPVGAGAIVYIDAFHQHWAVNGHFVTTSFDSRLAFWRERP